MQVWIATSGSIVTSALLVFSGFRMHIALAASNPLWWLWAFPILIFIALIAFMVGYYSKHYFDLRGY